jgi:hypothetical protein
MKLRRCCHAGVLLVCAAMLNARSYGKDIAYRVTLPDGYIGWVRVDFGVSDAPELAIDGWEATVNVPDTGSVETSSHMLIGMHDYYSFYYRTQSGLVQVRKALFSKTLDAGGFTAKDTDSAQEIKPLSWYFFIGPKSLRNGVGRNITTMDLANRVPLPKPGRIVMGSMNH